MSDEEWEGALEDRANRLVEVLTQRQRAKRQQLLRELDQLIAEPAEDES